MSHAPTDTATSLLNFVTSTFGSRQQAGTSLDYSSALFSTGLIDSMGLIELLAFVERAFGLSWDATLEELTALDTVEQIAGEIERRRAASAR